MTSFAVTIRTVQPLKARIVESTTTTSTYVLAQRLVDYMKTKPDFVSAKISKEYK